jgi:hypothetical protein
VLKQVAERERGDDHERAGNIAYALALKGPAGKNAAEEGSLPKTLPGVR